MSAMASPNLKLQLCAAASNPGDLPLDAQSEILLRLPAKELCRLRAVSPSWRSLTYDPTFVAAHRTRHSELFLAFGFRGESEAHSVDIVDLSGKLVRRIPRGEVMGDSLSDLRPSSPPQWPPPWTELLVLRTRLDLVGFTCRFHPLALWALNPATGATLALPECYSEDLETRLQGRFYCLDGRVHWYAFGQVATGEYKALRITRFSNPWRQFCEAITIDASGSNHGMWRETHGPPAFVSAGSGVTMGHMMEEEMKCVVVGGVVHFLIDFRFPYNDSTETAVEPGSIVLFNLETEEWMVILHGPAPVCTFLQDNIVKYYEIHNIHHTSMDLWFLSDFEKGLWVKKYSLPPFVASLFVFPLLVLDDGRMFFRRGIMGIIDCYDLRTGVYTSVLEFEAGTNSRSIGIYTGSLLS
ncbi:unnamed protein product [Urochloa decumbens]|uniref:F-box domain-containing protein n=1 Tax=Urochloa decumbens TaxID=240449 RepID=A0ABC9G7A9_9POAL